MTGIAVGSEGVSDAELPGDAEAETETLAGLERTFLTAADFFTACFRTAFTGFPALVVGEALVLAGFRFACLTSLRKCLFAFLASLAALRAAFRASL